MNTIHAIVTSGFLDSASQVGFLDSAKGFLDGFLDSGKGFLDGFLDGSKAGFLD